VECAFGSTRRSYGQFSSRRLALFPPVSLEATPVELPFAAMVWVAMHGAIAIVSTNHPDYLDPNVIVGGLRSQYLLCNATRVSREVAVGIVKEANLHLGS
jgi:hypothetical protein